MNAEAQRRREDIFDSVFSAPLRSSVFSSWRRGVHFILEDKMNATTPRINYTDRDYSARSALM
jgi:hypothetical protein